MTASQSARTLGLFRHAPRSTLPWVGRLVQAVLQRRRNAKAAAWLDSQPRYLLEDIGIDRSAVADIRRHGLPSALPPSFWPSERS